MGNLLSSQSDKIKKELNDKQKKLVNKLDLDIKELNNTIKINDNNNIFILYDTIYDFYNKHNSKQNILLSKLPKPSIPFMKGETKVKLETQLQLDVLHNINKKFISKYERLIKHNYDEKDINLRQPRNLNVLNSNEILFSKLSEYNFREITAIKTDITNISVISGNNKVKESLQHILDNIINSKTLATFYEYKYVSSTMLSTYFLSKLYITFMNYINNMDELHNKMLEAHKTFSEQFVTDISEVLKNKFTGPNNNLLDDKSALLLQKQIKAIQYSGKEFSRLTQETSTAIASTINGISRGTSNSMNITNPMDDSDDEIDEMNMEGTIGIAETKDKEPFSVLYGEPYKITGRMTLYFQAYTDVKEFKSMQKLYINVFLVYSSFITNMFDSEYHDSVISSYIKVLMSEPLYKLIVFNTLIEYIDLLKTDTTGITLTDCKIDSNINAFNDIRIYNYLLDIPKHINILNLRFSIKYLILTDSIKLKNRSTEHPKIEQSAKDLINTFNTDGDYKNIKRHITEVYNANLPFIKDASISTSKQQKTEKKPNASASTSGKTAAKKIIIESLKNKSFNDYNIRIKTGDKLNQIDFNGAINNVNTLIRTINDKQISKKNEIIKLDEYTTLNDNEKKVAEYIINKNIESKQLTR